MFKNNIELMESTKEEIIDYFRGDISRINADRAKERLHEENQFNILKHEITVLERTLYNFASVGDRLVDYNYPVKNEK